MRSATSESPRASSQRDSPHPEHPTDFVFAWLARWLRLEGLFEALLEVLDDV